MPSVLRAPMAGSGIAVVREETDVPRRAPAPADVAVGLPMCGATTTQAGYRPTLRHTRYFRCSPTAAHSPGSDALPSGVEQRLIGGAPHCWNSSVGDRPPVCIGVVSISIGAGARLPTIMPHVTYWRQRDLARPSSISNIPAHHVAQGALGCAIPASLILESVRRLSPGSGDQLGIYRMPRGISRPRVSQLGHCAPAMLQQYETVFLERKQKPRSVASLQRADPPPHRRRRTPRHPAAISNWAS